MLKQNNVIIAVRERIRIYEEIEVYMYIYIYKKYNLFVTFLVRSFELLLGRAVLWVDVAVVTVVL